jgi:carbonic anhydrase
MAGIEPLLARNDDFANSLEWTAAAIAPRFAVYVISCLDPRVDPTRFLQRDLGDATVVRTVGGRVSPAVLEDLSYIGYLQHKVVPGGPRFEVVVVHHNDCGTHFLADPDFRHGYADLMGVTDDAVLAERAVVDPEKTVRTDVDLVLACPTLPRTLTVSGRVYDVTTGLLTTVVPATPMPEESS